MGVEKYFSCFFDTAKDSKKKSKSKKGKKSSTRSVSKGAKDAAAPVAAATAVTAAAVPAAAEAVAQSARELPTTIEQTAKSAIVTPVGAAAGDATETPVFTPVKEADALAEPEVADKVEELPVAQEQATSTLGALAAAARASFARMSGMEPATADEQAVSAMVGGIMARVINGDAASVYSTRSLGVGVAPVAPTIDFAKMDTKEKINLVLGAVVFMVLFTLPLMTFLGLSVATIGFSAVRWAFLLAAEAIKGGLGQKPMPEHLKMA